MEEKPMTKDHQQNQALKLETKSLNCFCLIKSLIIMEEIKKKIRSFQDLDVYQNSYAAMLKVFKHILPKLPSEEKYDMRDQHQRSSKAVPRLIAEGHSKRHQKKGFQKYLDDALAESNETIVSISQAKDLYAQYIDVDICIELISSYDIISRQIYNLSVAWTKFTEQKNTTNQ